MSVTCVFGFSPGTPVSSTNKTGRHIITEILLKVALNTITLTHSLKSHCVKELNSCIIWMYFFFSFSYQYNSHAFFMLFDFNPSWVQMWIIIFFKVRSNTLGGEGNNIFGRKGRKLNLKLRYIHLLKGEEIWLFMSILWYTCMYVKLLIN